MAGKGSAVNGRDGNSKRLGVKCFNGESVQSGDIILRQRGAKFRPGLGVGMGKDHTIFAVASGKVEFKPNRVINVHPAH